MPPVTSQLAPSLQLTRAEADATLEALNGPVYTQLKERPLIALLARLNEYKLQGALAS